MKTDEFQCVTESKLCGMSRGNPSSHLLLLLFIVNCLYCGEGKCFKMQTWMVPSQFPLSVEITLHCNIEFVQCRDSSGKHPRFSFCSFAMFFLHYSYLREQDVTSVIRSA